MSGFRDFVTGADRAAVRRLVEATGFFTPAETDIAVELVDETLVLGSATSGYEFLFADGEPGTALLGYACYGPVPGDAHTFDLYWIAVDPSRQRSGLGARLLAEAERRAVLAGAGAMLIDTSGRAQYGPTRAFYERMGYGLHRVDPDHYAPADDRFVYRRALQRPALTA